MNTLLFLVVALCISSINAVYDVVSSDGLVHFNNFKVVRAQLWTKEVEILSQREDLDVWSNSGVLVVGNDNDIMVSPAQLELLHALGVQYEVLIPDVEERMIAERLELSSASLAPMGWHDSYHSYAEIVTFLRNISTAFPSLARFTASAAKTVEGRDIPAITITGGTSTTKKRIFFSGGQHAREWVAPATVLYIIDQLVNQYGKDTTVTTIVNNVIFEIVPLMNPDGYLYTQTNRLWRKNRRRNSDGSYGVDLNRNWDDHWGGQGSSRTPSSDTYCGTAPFSEPEAAQVSSYLRSKGPFDGAIDFHSYSQLILRPYGWTTTPPSNDALAKSVGDGMRDQIRAVDNKAYTSQASWQLYYTTGSAQDWYFSKGPIPLAYTIELRDTGTYGFQLPPAQIVPTGRENFAAVKYFAQRVISG